MDRLELLIDAATAHGEKSESDHEVGDLQDILRVCWKLLTPEQQETVYLKFEERVSGWLGHA